MTLMEPNLLISYQPHPVIHLPITGSPQKKMLIQSFRFYI